jgi:hypothetical protein
MARFAPNNQSIFDRFWAHSLSNLLRLPLLIYRPFIIHAEPRYPRTMKTGTPGTWWAICSKHLKTGSQVSPTTSRPDSIRQHFTSPASGKPSPKIRIIRLPRGDQSRARPDLHPTSSPLLPCILLPATCHLGEEDPKIEDRGYWETDNSLRSHGGHLRKPTKIEEVVEIEVEYKIEDE